MVPGTVKKVFFIDGTIGDGSGTLRTVPGRSTHLRLLGFLPKSSHADPGNAMDLRQAYFLR